MNLAWNLARDNQARAASRGRDGSVISLIREAPGLPQTGLALFASAAFFEQTPTLPMLG
jgi:hypothetical protein